MASITIRNLEDKVKKALRVRGANNGRSMEEEARVILRDALVGASDLQDLPSIFRKHFGPTHGVNLDLPDLELLGEPPTLD